MASNRLKLNADKTKLMVETPKKLQQITCNEITNLGETVISAASSVRNLNAIFDSEMTLASHVNAVVKAGFYQLRQLRTIRRLLTMDAAKTLVNSFVSSRIDYCNSVLYGTTDATHK